MGQVRKVATVAAGGAVVLLVAATRPTALAEASPGLWEISGLPNARAAVRQCVSDTTLLARVEHREASCTQVVIRDQPSSAEIHYTCANGGFGRTKMTVLTPRSLRIETQGISANSPFNYVIQARRIGSCTAR